MIHKCECPERADGSVSQYFYEPEEYKAMQHEPYKCPGDYLVKKYERDGNFLWLCSCCYLFGDEEVIQ